MSRYDRARAYLDRVMPAARQSTMTHLFLGQSNNRTGNSGDTATSPITHTDVWTIDKDDPANERDFFALTMDATGTGGTHAHGPGSPAHGICERVYSRTGLRQVCKMLAVSGAKMLNAANGPEFHWEVDVNTDDSLVLSDDPNLSDGVRHLHMPQVDAAFDQRPDFKEDYRVAWWWQGENEHGQMGITSGVDASTYAAALNKTFNYYRDNWGVDLFCIFKLQDIGADAGEQATNAAQTALVRAAHEAVISGRSDCIEVWDGAIDPANMYDATHPKHDHKLVIGRAAADLMLEELGLYTP